MYAQPVGRELDSDTESEYGGQWFMRSMLSVMIACVLMAGFPDDAMARGGGGGRSGGRMGGRAPSSTFRSAPRSAPRAAPSSGGSRTTINTGPTIINRGGGYGYGYGGYRSFSPFGFGGMGGYGMYGMGPFGYGYNPALSIGLTVADVLINEQRR